MTFDPNNPTASGMVLTFDDEFDNVSWSDNNYATGSMWTDHGSSPGIGIETASASALSLGGGVLTMTASDNNGTWDSGFFQTVNTSGQGWTQKYGYFEADIKLPAGVNAWPGFWLYHTSGPASELDVMESGDQTTPTSWAGTVHDGYGNQNSNNVQDAGVDLSAGYHRFGLLWDPNSSEITWFLDGKEIMTAPKYSDTDQSPMTMLLNLAVENNGGGSSPMSMYVDYVRAYQFSSQNPTAVAPEAVSTAAGNTDPTAEVNALGQGSTATATGSSTSTSTSGSSTTSSGPDTLTLHVSGDHYNGDPEIAVLVDGKQVGTYDISADHGQGQWQDITVSGNFDPTTAHQVQVQFLNDGWDGTSTADGHDRNVYVGSITMDGHTIAGTQAASNTGTNGENSSDPNAAELHAPGAVAYNLAANPSAATGSSTTGSGSTNAADTLTLHVSGDHYNGDPEIAVLVDGKQVGTYDISASHGQGQWQDIAIAGDFDPTTAHQVQVQFLNDGWDGTSTADGHDRNVYVGSITMDGQTIAGTQAASNTGTNGENSSDPNAAELHAPGAVAYDVPANPDAASGSSTATDSGSSSSTSGDNSSSASSGLTLHVSGDHYNGDPEIAVTVDGHQVGTYDITASHGQGQWQDIAVAGDFDPTTAHQVQVQFLNDGWDGTSTADGHDRNVYVGSITMDGHTIAGTQAASNTGTNGENSSDPNAAELHAPGIVTYNVPADTSTASGSSTATTGDSSSGSTTDASAPVLQPSFTDNAGHDVFMFSSATAPAGQIANFDPGHDVLDLAPLLQSIGYTGNDPIGDHVVDLVQSGTDSTAVVLDPTGHDASHGTTVVTLDHVLPQSVTAANVMH